MLYKIDKQSKINFINLVNSFMLRDGNKTDEKIKLLANLEKSLLGNENSQKIEYREKNEIKKIFYEIHHKIARSYLKDILLEINEKNNYKEDGIVSKLPFTNSVKGEWEKWLKSELK